MAQAKRLFIAATRQNDGKTMTSLGLFHAFQKRFESISYMKPVGQQYKIIDDKKIDKDAVLFSKTYKLQDPLALMSPIAVPRGFTKNYILDPSAYNIPERIQTAYDDLSENKDFILIEGTGHAGVGSVFDMGNADVAKLLDTKVIIVSQGGIGKSIDEILLNKACFDQKGIEILGVIINKVVQDKYDEVVPVVRQGLERHGLKMLGAIPLVSSLSKPNIAGIIETLGAKLLSGEECITNSVEKFIIGDLQPHDALNHFTEDTLLIAPSNREGLIMTALCGNLLEFDVMNCVSGIVLTSGIEPDQKILDLIKRTNIPLMLVEEDSFAVATKINNMLVKIRSEESQKISLIQDLIEEYIDVDALCTQL